MNASVVQAGLNTALHVGAAGGASNLQAMWLQVLFLAVKEDIDDAMRERRRCEAEGVPPHMRWLTTRDADHVASLAGVNPGDLRATCAKQFASWPALAAFAQRFQYVNKGRGGLPI